MTMSKRFFEEYRVVFELVISHFPSMLLRLPLLILALMLGLACQSKYSTLPTFQPATQPAIAATHPTLPQPSAPLRAVVAPPVGWRPDALEDEKDHAHQTWVSPTGKTAYGVIYFGIPLPMPAPWLLGPFVDEMKKREGKAEVLGQPFKDENLPGVRFIVETKQYRMRINLIVRGFRAWAVYAGTRTSMDEAPAELQQAEVAREQTKVGETSGK